MATFPTSLNSFSAGDTILSAEWNAIETKIGIDSSAVATSLDYLIKNTSSKLGKIASLAVTNSNFIVGDGTNWVAESGATARDSLSLGTGDSPTFAGLTLTGDILTSTASLNMYPGTGSNGLFSAYNDGGAESGLLIYGNTHATLANVTNFKNAGSVRMSILASGNVGIGTTSPDRLLHAEKSSALTNTVQQVARLTHITSGTPANSIGVGLEFEQETSASNNEIIATVEAVVTDVTATSEDADLVVKLMAGGAAAAEKFRIKSVGGITVPQVNDAAAPTLAFGDGDTGLYEYSDDGLRFAFSGNARYTMIDGRFTADAGTGQGPAMMREIESATNPVWSFEADTDTGIGQAAADQLSLIAGGVEGLRITEAASAITIATTSTFDITGALTATSYGGITEANLLDKSATETVSGAYTFTSNITAYGLASDYSYLGTSYSDTSSNEAGLSLRKSHQDTVGNTVTIDTERLGAVSWSGNTGSAFIIAARIRAVQNGAYNTRIPADLIFETSTNAAFNEALRLDSSQNATFAGVLGIAGGSPTANQPITISVNTASSQAIKYVNASTGRFDISADVNATSIGSILSMWEGKWNGSTVASIRLVSGSDTTNKDNGRIQFYTKTDNAGGQVLALKIDEAQSLTALPTYSQDVGATTRDLLIDNTGLIGYQASSKKFKKNIKNLTGSERIYDLRPVSFDWKKGGKGIGIIAEEADKVMPEIVSYKRILEKVKDENGEEKVIVKGEDRTCPETVNKSQLIIPMLAEIQRLNNRIKVLENK